MVSISHETSAEIDQRLRHVIREAKFRVWQEPFGFEEFPISEFGKRADPLALALVRDDEVWSQLVPSDPSQSEKFAVWRFHFPPSADNSGFVGWLATLLKVKFGTGVFVTCGSNAGDGGIFDYWGCPWDLKEQILPAITRLTKGEEL